MLRKEDRELNKIASSWLHLLIKRQINKNKNEIITDCIKCYKGNKVVWQGNRERLTSVTALVVLFGLFPKTSWPDSQAGDQRSKEKRKDRRLLVKMIREVARSPSFITNVETGLGKVNDWSRSQAGTERIAVISEDRCPDYGARILQAMVTLFVIGGSKHSQTVLC